MTLFDKKYRIESTRLKDYDYSKQNGYYITICVKEHIHRFGKVENDKIILNDIGKIVEKHWLEIPNKFPNVELDSYIIMPNHMHGIIGLFEEDNSIEKDIQNKNIMTYDNLSKIIRYFKGITTHEINKHIQPDKFFWQERFYDEIIKSEKAYFSIREYIANNPGKWCLDKENYK